MLRNGALIHGRVLRRVICDDEKAGFLMPLHAHGKRAARSVLLVAALTFPVFAGIAAPAQAAPNDHPTIEVSGDTTSAVPALSPDVLRSTRSMPSSAEQLDETGGDPRVLDYWTPERIAGAVPVETPELAATEVSPRTLAAEEPETSISEAALPTESSAGVRAAPPVTNFSKTNGKVFFRDASDGKTYMCSGAALNSGSLRLVATAGHCVHGGPGKTWHQNWVFIPGYHKGSRPYGTFTASRLRTFSDWINHGQTGLGFNSDVAFVTTYTSTSGSKLVNAVGGHRLTYGGNYDFDASNFGYPGNLDSGEVMWACWGTTGSRLNSLYRFHSMSGCNFGGGASGGPWLANYSNATDLGSIRTINSFGPASNTSYIAGPYLDSRIVGLYNDANNDW
ncbi:trypsin-like serine peptidase [Leifsonia aquatica]|uniref:trypsin-like serine peptidase n=1 Tax=Leifsonia aquatica TaxID=144185 RepID=UPI00381F2635